MTENKDFIEEIAPQEIDPTEDRAYFRKMRRDKIKKKKSAVREFFSWVICLVSAVLIATFLRTFIFELVLVDGDSMLPTLTTGETVFVEKLSKLSHDGIETGEIIIVHYPGQGKKAYVKRVIGLPGDVVSVKGGELYINGELTEESFTLEDRMNLDFEEYTVPEDCYFVMGDNRNDSWDSRAVGCIPKENIVGHAACVIWPLNEMKLLD